VGDIESLPYLEAIRQMRRDLSYENTLFIHNTLVPYLETSGELKTKPTQHSVKELKSIGISPDIIILRSRKPLNKEIKDKIALFCDVRNQAVIECQDVDVLYEVMVNLKNEKLDHLVCKQLKLHDSKSNIEFFEELIDRIKHINQTVRVALVGKYISLKDAYLSVVEALNHAGYANHVDVEIHWINSSKLKLKNHVQLLSGCDGILVPGGFGERGIEGKLIAIQYARTKNIPFLGLCLGMQLSVVEFARHVCNLKDAHSTEFNPDTLHNVIDYIPDQYEGINLGGTLRLGLYDCRIQKDTLAYQIYNQDLIKERHRHRYEFNNKYKATLASRGMFFSGINPETNLVEMIEIKNHPFYIAVQFHPEFLSRPDRPHPLFKSFIKHLK
ncbi:MAG TPA: CTP synthase, partial [Candidatus Izemoplasmatales bacterium]|nr:CTP synthase [Candidatus Izemoplasmatales bacterium]